jgi:hypothetical protein
LLAEAFYRRDDFLMAVTIIAIVVGTVRRRRASLNRRALRQLIGPAPS